MIIDQEDLGLFVKAGITILVAILGLIIKVLYKDFRTLQKEMNETKSQDKLIAKDIQNLDTKVDSLQRTINKVLSITLKKHQQHRKDDEQDDDEY